MKLRRVALIVLSLVFLLGLSSPGMSLAADKPIKWRMATLYPRGIAYEVVYFNFAENVKKMSNGRLESEVIFDGEGVAATEVLGATRTGLVQVGSPYMALHAGELPAGLIELGLPGALTEFLQIRTLFHEGGWIKALRQAYAKHNLYYVAEWSSPGTYLVTKKPIQTSDDLKELKIRAPGPYGKMLKNLGAAPVTMAFSEIYTSLATGVIDGVDGCNIIDHRDGKFYEVAKWMYPLPLTGAQTCPLIVNMDAWKKLPDDLKEIVTMAARWGGDEWAMKSLVWEKAALKEMMAAGLKMSPMPSEEDKAKWIAAGRKVWPEYEQKDADCKNLIKIQREFIKKLGLQ
ncbi:MAG: TRAP transporter substrate-binding protein DctP [Deltaproteobacteria bacterium]|nr:TRAP transporter substrate-binding protein DctP [Deltaproteobacteria bacterium]